MSFGCNALTCVSINNQECRAKPEVMEINNNEPLFYPCSIFVNKCSGSCNNINDPFEKLCVPDVLKGKNFKVFNLMWRTNETRYIGWYGTCWCNCRLDARVCNNKKTWNKEKRRSEFKELIDKRSCDKEFIIYCDCKCDKWCDVAEYLDCENCKCRKRLIKKLVQKYSENIGGNTMIYNKILDDHENVPNSCRIYLVLVAMLFIISISTANVFLFIFIGTQRKDILKQQFIKHINGKNQTN